VFLVFGGEEELVVTGYTDVGFQIDPSDSKSQSSFMFCLGAVSWKSSKQDIVVDSTMEPEYIAASEAIEEVIWIRNFVSELGVVLNASNHMDFYCDYIGAIV
jgi:hypothetical protein